jgi:hypothetical protein
MLLILFLSSIALHLAGSLVAFDTTTENYTVPVSGKCVLTCYVAEVRSFKVSVVLSCFVQFRALSCQSIRVKVLLVFY